MRGWTSAFCVGGTRCVLVAALGPHSSELCGGNGTVTAGACPQIGPAAPSRSPPPYVFDEASRLRKGLVVHVRTPLCIRIRLHYITYAFNLFPRPYLENALNQGTAISTTVRGLPPNSDPVVYNRSGARTPLLDQRQPGLTAVSSNWQDLNWKPAVRLLDAKGTVVHQWRTSPDKIFPSLYGPFAEFRRFPPPFGFHLYPNGDLLVNAHDMGLARLNACGTVQWRLLRPDTHHSGSPGRNGSFWLPGGRTETVSFPGLEGFEVDHDLIVRVSRQGEVTKTISLLDVLHQNDLQDRIFRTNSGGLSDGDLTHLNDVERLPDSLASEYPGFEAGDLLLSLREIHSVLVLDPDTENVKWIESDPFIRQHDPDFIGNGWIGVFDNNWDGTSRGRALGGSRIVAVHPQLDSTRVLFPTPHSDTLYTKTAGRWQQLDNGNMLLTESRAGRVAEVNPSGELVWEWIHPPHQSLVSEVYGAERVDVTKDKVAEWDCAGNTAPNSMSLSGAK